jgi:hypothetical protein
MKNRGVRTRFDDYNQEIEAERAEQKRQQERQNELNRGYDREHGR